MLNNNNYKIEKVEKVDKKKTKADVKIENQLCFVNNNSPCIISHISGKDPKKNQIIKDALESKKLYTVSLSINNVVLDSLS